MMNFRQPLIILLDSRQGDISNSAFAKKLSVPRTVWVEAKGGKAPIGLTLLKAIVRTFPELCPEVIEFLKDGSR